MTRFLARRGRDDRRLGSVSATSWVVESDALATSQKADRFNVTRPAVPVPVAAGNGQPWQWMGRVVELEPWLAGADAGVDFLSGHTAPDRKPLAVTAVGFLGPGFAAYYPDCCSVFGFWDTFADATSVHDPIASNAQVRFEASYQVFGWIDDPTRDPLATLVADAISAYAARVAQCKAQSVAIDTTPEQVVAKLVATRCRWDIKPSAVAASVDRDGRLISLDAPSRSLCAGTIQSVLWDSGAAPSYSFLGNGDGPGPPVPVWTDTIKLAAGNTPVEALSVLLKDDAGNPGVDRDIADNDEFLLDALQLGLLYGIEQKSNRIVDLEEMLHARAFSAVPGGHTWTVQPRLPDLQPSNPADDEVTLPIALAEQLAALNTAQKAYDQGRAQLQAARRQLFLDWYRFVKIYTGADKDDHVDANTLGPFISNEIKAVSALADRVGLLTPTSDASTQRMTGLTAPRGTDSLAVDVYKQYQIVSAGVAKIASAVLQSQPMPPFWLPSEPVLLMQGDRIEPVRRNGGDARIAVRTLSDVIDTLKIVAGTTTASIGATALPGLTKYGAPMPMLLEIGALTGEARLTVPMLADDVIAAWAGQGGAGNPAVARPADALGALQSAQGGPGAGLFQAIRASGSVPAANPVQTAAGALSLSVEFTNAAGAAWAPDPVGWTAQTLLPEFSPTRLDPFLPVFLVWNANLTPIARRNGNSYTADNISAFYSLGPDAIDLAYLMTGTTPVPFTTGTPVGYIGSSVLSKRPTSSLVEQIDAHLRDHPDDSERAELEKLRDIYAAKRIMSQSLTGLPAAQTLRTPVPAIGIQDLPKGGRLISTAFKAAIAADPADNWYDEGFNNLAPIATGIAAQQNFGPLGGGLMDVSGLEIVDVFGQRMVLRTKPAGIDTIPAYPMRAQQADAVNASRVVLPPRLLAPTRLWFRWLSAAHDASLPDSFVEMNAHPATSPVCGWILPNHLDDSLFFYDADGTPVGLFGLEHGVKVYRTRPGRIGDDLPRDIKTINPHLASVLQHLDAQTTDFLIDLMATLLTADSAVHSSRAAQDAGLAVLMGQPVAIARAVVGLETFGGRPAAEPG